jgi:hypothetical protein
MMIEAVRRDLYGQSGVADQLWPGAVPRVLDGPPEALASFADARETAGQFIDSDGNEILSGSPLRRYGVGVLVPSTMTREREAELTTAQEADTEEETDGVIPPADDTEDPGHAEVEDAADDRPARPRSMALSFLVDDPATEVRIHVTGGRYDEVPVSIGGTSTSYWRRQQVTFNVQGSGDVSETHEIGALHLRAGVIRRPHASGMILTAFLVNESPVSGDLPAATRASLFQAHLEVELPEVNLLDYPVSSPGDDQSLNLLYHSHPVLAVGHGCDVSSAASAGTVTLSGSHFPVFALEAPTPAKETASGVPLEIGMDALASWSPAATEGVEAIIAAYGSWVAEKRSEVEGLAPELQETARSHLDGCDAFLDDVKAGWDLARSDVEVQETLRWTSEAMADQRRAYAATTRRLVIEAGAVVGVEGADPHAPGGSPPVWRAFQIAFLLASLPAAVDGEHHLRTSVDIIWFATGAGKTEAYSGVAAFTILWRRRHRTTAELDDKEGATILMRYTLRLLTAQQLQRAASLICALELIRQREPALSNGERFSIGAWLGSASTPNDRDGAKRAFREWRLKKKRAFLLMRCPWCATAIGRRPGDGEQAIDGYKARTLNSGAQVIMAYCPNLSCEFNDAQQRAAGLNPRGLPVFEVDQDIYAARPTFVVGTVDKFAMLSWRSEPSSLFGIEAGLRKGPSPDLLIQDELHLIAGPLGSLDALYEPVLKDLCTRDGGKAPRIIAATATAKRFTEQVGALYGGLGARLVPPPGLDADDNFFARVDEAVPRKVFVGIYAPNLGPVQEAQIRLIAALSHAAGSLDAIGVEADPWWTNLCFFSSRRTLGLIQSLCQTHLGGHTWRLHRSTGVSAGPPRSPGAARQPRRAMSARPELTAQATEDISQAMERLGVRLDEGGAADMCFATSMIEVGVDIDRLGLMTMFGQPKSASQYIQVAGRVGRDLYKAPGLVFVLLSPYNSRDRSHFEQFSTFHERLYASVEPVSITPFTPASLQRGLAGAMTAWFRQAVDAKHPYEALASFDEVTALFVAFAPNDEARGNVERQAKELRATLAATELSDWGLLQPNQPSSGFLRPQGELLVSPEEAVWEIPTSMRSVDAESGARTLQRARSSPAPAAPRLSQPHAGAPAQEDLL